MNVIRAAAADQSPPRRQEGGVSQGTEGTVAGGAVGEGVGISAAFSPLGKTGRLFQLASLLRGNGGHGNGAPEGPVQHGAGLSVRELTCLLFPAAQPQGPGWSGMERAVQRDLADLQAVEPDFERLAGRPPRYRIRREERFTPPELLALIVRRSGQAGSAELAHLRRLAAELPVQVRGAVERQLGREAVASRPGPEAASLGPALSAWLAGRPLRFEQRGSAEEGAAGNGWPDFGWSGSGWSLHTADPYLIAAAGPSGGGAGRLLLWGRDHADGLVRAFPLSRMRRAEVQERLAVFRVPEDFAPPRPAPGPFAPGARLRLRLTPAAARELLEGELPAPFPLSEPLMHADGCVDVEVDAPLAPLPTAPLPATLRRWVLGFGAQVQVLGPPAACEWWQGELRLAAANGAEARRRSGGR